MPFAPPKLLSLLESLGSNPTLSASKSELQRNCPTAFREIRERCPFSASFAPETGLERADCGMNQSRVSRVFSGLARSSPPLKRSQGECLAIINRIIRESDLTLVRSPRHRRSSGAEPNAPNYSRASTSLGGKASAGARCQQREEHWVIVDLKGRQGTSAPSRCLYG